MNSGGIFDLPKRRQELAALEQQSSEPTLWDDPNAAQKLMQRLSGAKADLEELDDGLPEGFALRHAPGVQARVVGQLQAMALIDEAAEGVHPGGGDTFLGGGPQGLLHVDSSFGGCRDSCYAGPSRRAEGTLAYWARGALTCSDPYYSAVDLAAVVAVLHRRQSWRAVSGALALQPVNKV